MAFSLTWKCWIFLLTLFFFSVSCCISEGDPTSQIVGRALQCFDNGYIYKRCYEAYRLTESGRLDVPRQETDAFCGGPCFVETDLVLRCVSHVLSHFTFYNRATLRDVRNTLRAGCSYGRDRGNFNVWYYMYRANDGYYGDPYNRFHFDSAHKAALNPMHIYLPFILGLPLLF
ncbi:PREDICTED: uncharacterized protein LOC104605113 [Nelumbo nucifera]|uniref:Uncharacterized protein LOC104605113 n=1 Tax=Nelumbo nucifera TaxID=4432 RepID=A0A1U8AY83_NELNU|nr:PREDICTED: uncharacterized protein LOC104605113 [Nelumbo nucifera]